MGEFLFQSYSHANDFYVLLEMSKARQKWQDKRMPLDLRALEEAGKSVEEAKANLQTLLEQCTQLFV